MTRSAWFILVLGGLMVTSLVGGCDVWRCLLDLYAGGSSNPNYLQQKAGTTAVAVPSRPSYVAVSPDGRYVAVASWGSNADPNGSLSLFPTAPNDPGDPNNVTSITVGDRPYGLTWLDDFALLVCNEGLAATGGDAPLNLVRFYRDTDDPSDPDYYRRGLGDPNKYDVSRVGSADPNDASFLAGPSEAVALPGGGGLAGIGVFVSVRFDGAVLWVADVMGVLPTVHRILTDPADGIDEPRGIDINNSGSDLWICNYGSGANNRTALDLVKELIAAQLNLFNGAFDDLGAAARAELEQTISDAQQWLADNADPDGRVPLRWPEPDEGPNQNAVDEATDLSADLRSYNTRSACPNPDPNHCAHPPEDWAQRPTAGWPVDPNVDPNAADPNSLDLHDPANRYAYASDDPNVTTVSGILNRDTDEQGEVTVFGSQKMEVDARIPVPPRPRSVRLTPDGASAVVTCSGDDGLTGYVVVISTASRTVTAERLLPFVPALVRIHPLGGRAYISSWTGNQMAVLNLDTACVNPLLLDCDTTVYTTIQRPTAIDVSGNIDVLWTATFSNHRVVQLDVFEGTIRIGD